MLQSLSRRLLLTTVAALLCNGVVSLRAQESSPARPRITGISHVGYFVTNLQNSLYFWHNFLGFDESYSLTKKNSDQVRIAFIKINDHQHIELFNEPATHPPNMMSHICFTVDDIQAMHLYLESKGYHLKPSNGGKTRTGDYAFEITDPDGMLVEFVQSLPTGMEAQAAGKFEPATRISAHIYHVGFLVGNSQKSLDFYGNLLGFKETWRGGGNPHRLSWINMRVPDGTDYVEFMLYQKLPRDYGVKNHISLEVPSVPMAVKTLEARPAYKVYGKEMKVAVGVNQKRQVNLYDPDGTRVELMEPNTITGKPTPSSTAPPPTPSNE